ncbi:hypothetical protein Y88_3732 [Novosphingobium nitrogenifigens DSM 19370]|uniref:DUF4402 domain-containing protein n=1 Tax=Novosphingobium nitrogenifigens DSM 19370 TaxID=983920 RepID=F1ZDD6_9SPHN|nr:DUF4402 domain-containing protein [Novosphingobium nitrogenifigens]EGD57422.1 hypothetical protein Y88_3732 [Novosphingobium nitrogenifigens DSM 19370]
MKGIAIRIAAGLLVLAPGSQIACAASSSATGVATASIVRPLTVTADADMDFGTITHAPRQSGTVTVSPGSAGASYGGAAGGICAGTACGDAHSAHFTVKGEPLRSYAIQLPSTVAALPDAAAAAKGAPSLQVGALTLHSASGTSEPRLDAVGQDSFEVGGTLTLPADAPAAHYRATLTIMVTYI